MVSAFLLLGANGGEEQRQVTSLQARPTAKEAEGADGHVTPFWGRKVDTFPEPAPGTASFFSFRDDAKMNGNGRLCRGYEV